MSKHNENIVIAEPVNVEDYNYHTLDYFFKALIFSCCLVLTIPSISKNPNTMLFCYFFIAISLIVLFILWYYKNPQKLDYLLMFCLPALLFIIISILSSFIVISNNRTNIQKGLVTKYYYKFNFITICLILIESYLYFNIISEILKNRNPPQAQTIAIVCFCVLSYFIIWSNSIGLSHFSADG
jgi:hypothetical protein